MVNTEDSRETVLKTSRASYAHRAYYEDLLVQRQHRVIEVTKLEVNFIEKAFSVHVTYPVKDVLDVACGSGRHIFGLAKRGYKCTGLDYTPERIQIAQDRAKHIGVSVKLLQGDATQLDYENEFDAVLALYILFLLPNDNDVLKALVCAYRALRKGGILICNIENPFYAGKSWGSLQTIHKGSKVTEYRAPGIGFIEIEEFHDFDPITGVVWIKETNVVETPEAKHVFRDRERVRLLTYWDILHYLQKAGFKNIKCYPDWKIMLPKKGRGESLVFVAQKS